MRRPPRRALLLGILAATVLAVGALAAPALASPAPIDVCPPCGDGFVAAASSEDVDVDVEESAAVARVREDGTATFVVRNRLSAGPPAERLRGNPALVERIGENAFRHGYSGRYEPRLIGTNVTDDVVVLRYRIDGFATRAAGALRVDYLRENPGGYVYTGLGADRLTVVGPPGTTAARAPGWADVEGRNVTLTSYQSPGQGPFVVYAGEGAPAPSLLGLLAVLDGVAGVVLGNVFWLLVVPGAVLAGVLRGEIRVAGRFADRLPRGRTGDVAAAVAGLGALAAIHPAYAGIAPVLVGYRADMLAGGVAAALVGVGIVAADAADVRPSLPRLYALVGGAIALGAAVALAVPDVGAVDPAGVDRLLRVTLPVLPVLLALPLGYAAVEGESRTRAGALLATLAGFAAVAATFFSLTASGGALFFVVVLLLCGFAVLVGILGAPLFALGALLAADDSTVGV
jgi:hypothetical protein